MVPDQSKTCLGLEYFCSRGDDISSLSNAQLVELAKSELEAIGLVERQWIVDATVVRVPNAYPVYDEDYEQALSTIREYVSGFANLQTIGRNGTHTYNNQDHSMVMGMLAVRNLFGDQHDVWTMLGGQLDCFRPVGGLGDDGQIGLAVDQGAEAVAHQGLVVGEQYPDHVGVSTRWPAS